MDLTPLADRIFRRSFFSLPDYRRKHSVTKQESHWNKGIFLLRHRD
jgi:hypothetical protein